MPPVELWAWAFGWTVALEVPVVMLGVGRRLGSWPRALAVAVGLQVLTHPTLWFVFPQFEPYVLWLVVAEIAVTTVEALALTVALRRAGVSDAVARGGSVAIAANLLSTAVGLTLV